MLIFFPSVLLGETPSFFGNRDQAFRDLSPKLLFVLSFLRHSWMGLGKPSILRLPVTRDDGPF